MVKFAGFKPPQSTKNPREKQYWSSALAKQSQSTPDKKINYWANIALIFGIQ
jgi:hypothetical protein